VRWLRKEEEKEVNEEVEEAEVDGDNGGGMIVVTRQQRGGAIDVKVVKVRRGKGERGREDELEDLLYDIGDHGSPIFFLIFMQINIFFIKYFYFHSFGINLASAKFFLLLFLQCGEPGLDKKYINSTFIVFSFCEIIRLFDGDESDIDFTKHKQDDF